MFDSYKNVKENFYHVKWVIPLNAYLYKYSENYMGQDHPDLLWLSVWWHHIEGPRYRQSILNPAKTESKTFVTNLPQ